MTTTSTHAPPTAPGITAAEARVRGVYYTPLAAARTMARWLVQGSVRTILEPSMGDGVFLTALEEVSTSRQGKNLVVTGVEHSKSAIRRVVQAGLIPESNAICSDFLALRTAQVDGVIGNPPYVRLRNLPADEASRAMHVARESLGVNMDPSGSVWMPFTLKSTQALKPGGRMALVLPYDFTYVRYARPLWQFLGDNFAHLRVVRVRERLFPDILQETVVLYADGKGGKTKRVAFEAFESAGGFEAGTNAASAEIDLGAITRGERVFTSAVLPPATRKLLAGLGNYLQPVSDAAEIHIGYVSGDKRFFHPTEDVAASFSLPPTHLRPALTSSRQISGIGLLASASEAQHLYLPPPEVSGLSEGDVRYLQHGESLGVPGRYKCKVRDPWFVVPGVRIPEVVFPVFTERPLMVLNDAGAAVSNSLLCGYLRKGISAEALVCSWYTSLTKLQMELNVHSLGGGVFVLVPNEVSAIQLVPLRHRQRDFARIKAALSSGGVDAALESGDLTCLVPDLGLSANDVHTIRSGCATLAEWRQAGQ